MRVKMTTASTFRHRSFVQEVRLFGSPANGIARRSSDLDLTISSPEATPAERAEFQICQELLTEPNGKMRAVLDGMDLSQSLQTILYVFSPFIRPEAAKKA
jgi:hypothetical protein